MEVLTSAYSGRNDFFQARLFFTDLNLVVKKKELILWLDSKTLVM